MRLLEVEHKFAWTQAKLKLLHLGTGQPPFKKLTDINIETLRDTYYDKNNKLSSTGLWLRKRKHIASPHHKLPLRGTLMPGAISWQAKQGKKHNSYLRSTFEETEDMSQILGMVRAHFPKCPGHKENFGLDVVADFETFRHTFLANDYFTIVLDDSNFDHQVGEVELLARPEDVAKAHAEIDDFVKEYTWFFDTTNPKGKLTAYFEKFGYPKELPSKVR